MVRYLLFTFVMITTLPSFAQIQSFKTAVPVIAAKDAYLHVGQLVVVKDSLYSGTSANDSTLVCQIGVVTSTPRLSMIFIARPYKGVPLNQQKFIRTFQHTKIEIYGTITGSTQAPQIIVYSNTGCLRFGGTKPIAW